MGGQARSLGLRRKLALGATLVSSTVLGGYRGYIRRAYAACTGAGGTYTCGGVLTTTQTLSGAPLSITTAPGFGINTAAGNAFDLSGTGGLSFTDNNASAISAAGTAINATNLTAGAMSITTSGTVTGTSNDGIFARNYGAGQSVSAANVNGGQRGIYAYQQGSGALSITSSGTVTGANGAGVFAHTAPTASDLTVNAANVNGSTIGIYALHGGTGALTITSTGTVTGSNVGINAYTNVGTTSLTLAVANVTGDAGIGITHNGAGALSITSTGTVTGTTANGIYFNNKSPAGTDATVTMVNVSGAQDGIHAIQAAPGALNITTTGNVTGAGRAGIYAWNFSPVSGNLVIHAANASGAAIGIAAYQYGSGLFSITTTGSVVGNGGAGILAQSTFAGSTTSVTVASGSSVSGTTAGVDISSPVGRTGSVTNAGTIAGVTGIRANGSSATISNSGTITGSGGTAIDLTAAAGPNTVNQQGGAITGAILLSASADQVHVTGGAINGNVTGQGNAGIDFALGTGSFTFGAPYTIAGMDNITMTSGTAQIDGTANTNILTVNGGTFIVNGALNNTGTIAINGGALQLGADSATGSLVGNITNNGTFVFRRNDVMSFAANMSGTGSVVQAGSGTTIVTTDQSFTGGTTISAGTLQLGNGGTTGFIVGDVVNNSALVFNRSDVVTFAGLISGTGSMTQAGNGTVILTANETLTGSTTIVAGTLQLGNGGTSGAVIGNITDNGVLAFDRSDAFTVTGSISGTGAIQQAGTGTTTLAGTNSFSGGTTITTGTLAGSAASFGSGAILDNAALVVDQPADAAFANAIGGSGSFTKRGAGRLNYTGTGTLSGTTTVAAGTLAVNGSLAASAVTVLSGAALGGSGTVGATTIQSGGRLAPGNSPGTLNIAGDLSLSSGSILDYELGVPGTPGVGSDLTNVSGNLTLDGAINISDAGGFGAGVYRLINYNGALSDNGLDIGRAPPGYQVFDMTVQTSVANQVNLVVGAPTLLNFWDGPNMTANGVVNGGTSVWNATNNNWTKAAGTPNGTYSPVSLLIFQASPGVVTIDNSLGAVSTVGMQFAVGGYTLAGGALTLNGPAPIRVGDGTAAGANYVTTVTADLIGPGSLEKTDLGTLILNGNNSFAGATTVTAGALVVNGSLASAVTVQSGARLGGNGTVGATTVRSGGTITPGNSIGTLHVTGAFTQVSGSIYQVEVDPNSNASDLIAVNGAATLQSGAQLNVTKIAPGDYQFGTIYKVLSTTSGLSGTYTVSGQTTGVSAFLGLKDSYDANNAYLTVVQTQSLASAATTPNQQTVAQAVDALPPVINPATRASTPNPVKAAVLNLPDMPTARSAFDQLSTSGQASAKGMLVANGLYVRDMAFERLRDVICPPDMGSDAHRSRCASDRPSVWGQGFGGWGGVAGNANAAGLNHSTAGMLVGVDLPVADWRLGLFGGFSRSDFRIVGSSASGDTSDYHLGVYGGTRWDAISLRLGASYSWDGITADRAVVFGTFTDRLHAVYDAGTTQAFGEVGYQMDMWGAVFEPFANMAYVNLGTSGFTEAGGPSALTAKSDRLENGIATLGIRPSTTVTLDSFEVTLRGMAGLRHTFGSIDPRSTVFFTGGNGFDVAGAPIARDVAAVELGLDTNLDEGISAGLTYGGQFSNRSTDQSLRAHFRVSF